MVPDFVQPVLFVSPSLESGGSNVSLRGVVEGSKPFPVTLCGRAWFVGPWEMIPGELEDWIHRVTEVRGFLEIHHEPRFLKAARAAMLELRVPYAHLGPFKDLD